uniref:Uncharacterized protein n=1 Tax=Arundo donax TaxID=35708 RepID=A0A0A8ZHY3_ARUDO
MVAIRPAGARGGAEPKPRETLAKGRRGTGLVVPGKVRRGAATCEK